MRYLIYGFWLAAVFTLALILLLRPELRHPEMIQSFVLDCGSWAVGCYFLISLLRGFLLLPSTPFVLAGTALFPTAPLLVITVSMLGILFSATLLYFFSDFLGFSSYLEKQHPEQIQRIRHLLRGKRAGAFVVGWSFFPFVPTDAICYVAGLIKMPYLTLMIGLFLGELALVTALVFLGKQLFAIV